MRVQSDNFYDAWYRLLRAVYFDGQECAPRGLKVRELIHTQLVVNDLRNNVLVHPRRDLNYRFMVAEWLWIRDGRNDVWWIERFNKQITRFSDNGFTFTGAYGPRLESQWDWLLETLRRDPDSRQAIATIWTPCPISSKDVPCTVAMQLLIRDRRLHGIFTMRSNDLWLGLPYDFFNFSQIVNGLAGDLGVEPGSLTLQAGSSHLYESNFEQMRLLLLTADNGYILRSPTLPCSPRLGITDALYLNQYAPLPDAYETYLNVLRVPTKAAALILLEGLVEKPTQPR